MNPRMKRIGALALVMAAAAACDTPVTDVSPGDRPVLKMIVAPGDHVLPSADIAVATAISDFDTSLDDAFDRSTGAAWRHFAGTGYAFNTSAVRGASKDLRSPTLGEGDFGVNDLGSGNFIFGLDPVFWDANIWDWWFGISDVPEDTRLWVGFARYEVQVNGALDQEDILLGRTPPAPDRLVLNGGTVGGDGTRMADLFNDDDPFPAEPNANPWVIGFVDSDLDGNASFDFVHSSSDANGNAVYYGSGGADFSASPIGPNELGTAFGAGQYNYIVIWTEDPTTTANPDVLLRIQVAADIMSGGSMAVNNAFAPFPDGITDLSEFRDLPGGADAFAIPGTITMTGAGLPTLEGRSYQAWVWSRESGSFAAIGAPFNSPGPGEEVEVSVAAGGPVDFSEFSHVVVSHEASVGATPSESQFLYFEYFGSDLSINSGAMTFGSFIQGGENTVYTVSGTGTGEFFGDSLFVRFRRVQPAPEGFHYASYLVRIVGPELVDQVRAGDVQLDAIGNGTARIAEADIGGDFGAYNTYLLVLEPDGSPGLNQMRIQISEDYASKFNAFFPLPGDEGGDGG